MMDPKLREKFSGIAKMAGLSPELLAKIDEEMSKANDQAKPSVASVSVEVKSEPKSGFPELGKLTDEEIAKFSPEEAKKALAFYRDEECTDMESETGTPEDKSKGISGAKMASWA